MGYIKNFINECRAYHIVKKVYKTNKNDFDKIGLKKDWVGRLYKVINRDPDIEVGSGEDEVYLRKELAEMWQLLVNLNIVDILAYELKPLEEEREIGDGKVEYEHGYLVTLTPAWRLDKQYVTVKSVIGVTLFFIALIGGLVYSTITWIIPYIQTLL